MSEERGEYQAGDNTRTVRSDVGRYAMMPEWVLLSGISSGAIHLYALLASCYADRHTNAAHPGRKTLGIQMGVSEDTVDRRVAELIGIGALEKRSRWIANEQVSNEYVLRYALPAIMPSAAATARGGGGNGAATSPQDCGTEPESVNQNQLTSNPGAGSSADATEPAPAPKGAKRAFSVSKSTFTVADRKRLIEKYQNQLPNPGLCIDQALNHKASDKWKDKARGVDDWLRREVEYAQSRGTTGTNSAPAPRQKIIHPVNIATPEMMAAAQKVIDDDKEHQRAKGRA